MHNVGLGKDAISVSKRSQQRGMFPNKIFTIDEPVDNNSLPSGNIVIFPLAKLWRRVVH